MVAYYNENDEYAAQWLRNLISAGHIAPGEVDERSIVDVRPDDLRPFTQCHFFAGIGVWSYSARCAGWPDDRPIWTGSCPCQPFSAAGKGAGFDDERHLWPSWFHLIGERKPPVIFGEQVAGKNGFAWLDLVQADLEGLDYACGAVVAPAAGFGAPHIRERQFWLAYAYNTRSQGRDGRELRERAEQRAAGPRSSQGRMGDAESERRERRQNNGDEGRRQRTSGQAGEIERLDDATGTRRNGTKSKTERETRDEARLRVSVAGFRDGAERPGPTNGFWRDADWLGCTDGKWRPVEPGTFPLADGAPRRVEPMRTDEPRNEEQSRVKMLRGYGNAINTAQATAFIEAAMQVAP